MTTLTFGSEEEFVQCLPKWLRATGRFVWRVAVLGQVICSTSAMWSPDVLQRYAHNEGVQTALARVQEALQAGVIVGERPLGDLAEMWEMPLRTLQRWCKDGEIPCTRRGKRWWAHPWHVAMKTGYVPNKE